MNKYREQLNKCIQVIDSIRNMINVRRIPSNAISYNDLYSALYQLIPLIPEEYHIFRDRLRDRTSIEKDGAKLMQAAFSVQKPIIKLEDTSTETGANIQQGYMEMFTGAIIGIRNPQAHNNLLITKDNVLGNCIMPSTKTQLLRLYTIAWITKSHLWA